MSIPLTIIAGLSLAAAIAIGAVGIEVADELLYKAAFSEGGRVVRLETQDVVKSRVEPGCSTISRSGGGPSRP